MAVTVPRLTLTRMAAPLAIWALHFVVVYSLQGLACAQQLWRSRVAGLETVTWALWLLTALALLAIAYEGLRAWRIRCALRDDAAARAVHDRRRFLALLTLLVALIAAIGVTFTAAPVALLPTCA